MSINSLSFLSNSIWSFLVKAALWGIFREEKIQVRRFCLNWSSICGVWPVVLGDYFNLLWNQTRICNVDPQFSANDIKNKCVLDAQTKPGRKVDLVIFLAVASDSSACLEVSARWWDSPAIRGACTRILLLILILSYISANAQTCSFSSKQQSWELSLSANDIILQGCCLFPEWALNIFIHLFFLFRLLRGERRLPVEIVLRD